MSVSTLTLTKDPVSTPRPRLTLMKRCLGECSSQCDACHSLENCVEASRRYGELIVCEPCRALLTRYEGVVFPIPLTQ